MASATRQEMLALDVRRGRVRAYLERGEPWIADETFDVDDWREFARLISEAEEARPAPAEKPPGRPRRDPFDFILGALGIAVGAWLASVAIGAMRPYVGIYPAMLILFALALALFAMARVAREASERRDDT